MNDKKIESIHFIGIGGSGMSPLAELAIKFGMSVSGSDEAQTSTTDSLVANGAQIFFSHDTLNIQDQDTIVISSAISQSNPEILAAESKKVRIIHRSEFLQYLMKDFNSIAVSGSHGKTTTSAMISHMLVGLGLDPSFAIGSKLSDSNSSCRMGKGDIFVAEADESDGSFLNYKPFLGIITNIGNDHLNFYKSEEAILEYFIKFGKNIHQDGCLIVGWDDKGCKNLKDHFPNKILSYGFGFGCDIRCFEYRNERDTSIFKVMIGKELIHCQIPLPGIHNIQNALCCLAVAKALNLDLQNAADQLNSFPGVKRRFEKIYQGESVVVIDDYAHNPDKIRSCIQGIKDSWPNHKLVTCFQPHRYSRLSSLFNDFIVSFSKSDKVVVLPVYSAGEQHLENLDAHSIAKSIEEHSFTSCIAAEDLDSAVDIMLKEQCIYTIFLTVGAGDVWKVANSLKNRLS